MMLVYVFVNEINGMQFHCTFNKSYLLPAVYTCL